jgi:hypothetical protein
MTTRLYMRRLLALSLIIQMSLPTLALADASTCKEGERWDVGLGRCVMNRSTSELQGDVTVCGSFSNPDDRRQCYVDNAKNRASDAELGDDRAFNDNPIFGAAWKNGENDNNQLIMMATTSVVGTAMLIGMAPTPNCMSNTSIVLMKAAGTTHAVNELGTWVWYKTELKKLEDKYTKIVEGDTTNYADKTEDDYSIDDRKTGMVDAQKSAFDYMAAREETFIKVAKVKRGLHAASAAAYGAAAAIAATEAVTDYLSAGTKKLASGCTPKNIPGPQQDGMFANNCVDRGVNIPPKGASVSTERDFKFASSNMSLEPEDKLAQLASGENLLKYFILFANMMSPLPSAYAGEKGIGAGVAASVGGSAAVVGACMIAGKASVKGLAQFMVQAEPRFVLAGLLATVNGVMTSRMTKEINWAKQRKEFFEKEANNFMRLAAGNIAPCTERDRSNTAKPQCYCYTKYGAKNPKRQGSQICAKQWEKNPSLDPTNYDPSISSNSGLPPVRCINNKLRRDPKCSCRVNNSCFKIGGKFKWPFGSKLFKKVASSLDKLNSGRLSGAELDHEGLKAGAIKLRDAGSKYIEQKGKPDKMKSIASKMAPGFKYKPALSNGIGGRVLGGGASSGAIASLAPELQKEIEEKMKAANVPGLKFKKGNMAKGNNSSKDDEFKFDFGDEATGGEGGVVVEGEQEAVAKFDYGQKDINQNDDTNLFDILSYRYKKSGLRRIYGDDDQAAVRDTANKTDISK